MDFGIVTAKIDEIGYITHAENLGYSHCWVTDSQMIRSNCWAVLALAAQQTRRMRLGTGVNVPGLRLAPVAANGIATINRLAPGRCFISLGTGHTAMRTLGQKPMRLGPFREYVQTVRALLRGDEVDYTLNNETHRIRFQMREHRFIDLYPPLPSPSMLAWSLLGELSTRGRLPVRHIESEVFHHEVRREVPFAFFGLQVEGACTGGDGAELGIEHCCLHGIAIIALDGV